MLSTSIDILATFELQEVRHCKSAYHLVFTSNSIPHDALVVAARVRSFFGDRVTLVTMAEIVSRPEINIRFNSHMCAGKEKGQALMHQGEQDVCDSLLPKFLKSAARSQIAIGEQAVLLTVQTRDPCRFAIYSFTDVEENIIGYFFAVMEANVENEYVSEILFSTEAETFEAVENYGLEWEMQSTRTNLRSVVDFKKAETVIWAKSPQLLNKQLTIVQTIPIDYEDVKGVVGIFKPTNDLTIVKQTQKEARSSYGIKSPVTYYYVTVMIDPVDTSWTAQWVSRKGSSSLFQLKREVEEKIGNKNILVQVVDDYTEVEIDEFKRYNKNQGFFIYEKNWLGLASCQSKGPIAISQTTQRRIYRSWVNEELVKALYIFQSTAQVLYGFMVTVQLQPEPAEPVYVTKIQTYSDLELLVKKTEMPEQSAVSDWLELHQDNIEVQKFLDRFTSNIAEHLKQEEKLKKKSSTKLQKEGRLCKKSAEEKLLKLKRGHIKCTHICHISRDGVDKLIISNVSDARLTFNYILTACRVNADRIVVLKIVPLRDGEALEKAKKDYEQQLHYFVPEICWGEKSREIPSLPKIILETMYGPNVTIRGVSIVTAMSPNAYMIFEKSGNKIEDSFYIGVLVLCPAEKLQSKSTALYISKVLYITKQFKPTQDSSTLYNQFAPYFRSSSIRKSLTGWITLDKTVETNLTKQWSPSLREVFSNDKLLIQQRSVITEISLMEVRFQSLNPMTFVSQFEVRIENSKVFHFFVGVVALHTISLNPEDMRFSQISNLSANPDTTKRQGENYMGSKKSFRLTWTTEAVETPVVQMERQKLTEVLQWRSGYDTVTWLEKRTFVDDNKSTTEYNIYKVLEKSVGDDRYVVTMSCYSAEAIWHVGSVFLEIFQIDQKVFEYRKEKPIGLENFTKIDDLCTATRTIITSEEMYTSVREAYEKKYGGVQTQWKVNPMSTRSALTENHKEIIYQALLKGEPAFWFCVKGNLKKNKLVDLKVTQRKETLFDLELVLALGT